MLKDSADFLTGSVMSEPQGSRPPKKHEFLGVPRMAAGVPFWYDLGQFRWNPAPVCFLGHPKLKGSANFLKSSVISEPWGRRVRKIVISRRPQNGRTRTVLVRFEAKFRWISATTGFMGPPKLKGLADFLKGSVISEPWRARPGATRYSNNNNNSDSNNDDDCNNDKKQ